MVEYRLRPEHVERVKEIQQEVSVGLAAVAAKAEESLRPILSFYGIRQGAKGYVQEKDGDISIVLPDAPIQSVL